MGDFTSHVIGSRDTRSLESYVILARLILPGSGGAVIRLRGVDPSFRGDCNSSTLVPMPGPKACAHSGW